jgi:hypothetical protein
MKTIIYLFSSIILIALISCQKKPQSGDWKGEIISFTVNEDGTLITRLNVAIPYEGEYLAQEYQGLKIEDNKFKSFMEGISFVHLPTRDLEGEFVSSTLAKGTFNDVAWEAKPE